MKRRFFPFLVFISVMLLLGCSENMPSSEGVSSETGSIAFNIIMGDTRSDVEESAIPRAMSDECGTSTQYEISGVGATVYSTPAVTGSWVCSAGGGTLTSVTPGNNLRLVIIGYNHSNFGNITIYSGETQVNVVAGQTATPTIVVEAFSADKTYPGQDATGIDPSNITFQWEPVSGADGYVIEVADRADFSDPNIVISFQEETANTSYTYFSALEENTIYYWGVFPIDIAGDSAYDTVWAFTTGTAGLPVADDNYEENDTLGTAYDLSGYELTYLSSINGLGVANSGDDDYYQIEITPGYEYLTIDCLFAHAGGDIDISLYTSDGTLVTSATGVVDNEHIEFDLTGYGSGGIYYIRVYVLGNRSNTYDLWWDDTIPIP